MTARAAIGLAIALLIVAMPLSLKAQAQAPRSVVTHSPDNLPPDLAFGRFIALIRGHLLAGDELVKRRDWNEAYPHFTFPTEEIYGVIRDELHDYRTPPFDGLLKTLTRTVKMRNVKQYPKAWEKVEEALAKADAGLKTNVPDWPRFVVAVAVEVLRTALDEYDEAIANDRIAHAVGYRTARGFILQADRMIEAVAPEFPGGDAASLTEIRAGFARIKPAFAVLTAPARPPIDAAALLAAVSQIETAAGKLAPGH